MLMTEKQASCALRLLNVPVSAENMRRVARARGYLDSIVFTGLDGADRLYKVVGTEVYDVSLNGSKRECSCLDAKKSPICKHQLACLMLEFKLEQASILAHEEYEADRFACDGNEVY